MMPELKLAQDEPYLTTTSFQRTLVPIFPVGPKDRIKTTTRNETFSKTVESSRHAVKQKPGANEDSFHFTAKHLEKWKIRGLKIHGSTFPEAFAGSSTSSPIRVAFVDGKKRPQR